MKIGQYAPNGKKIITYAQGGDGEPQQHYYVEVT